MLLLGAGGAARGALTPLIEAGAAKVVIANRTPAKAAALAREFRSIGEVSAASFAELAGNPSISCINATSASLVGEAPAIGVECFARGGLAYEMFYGKGLTPFLRLAEARRRRHASPMASACWSSRRRPPSPGGAGCVRTPPPSSQNCPFPSI